MVENGFLVIELPQSRGVKQRGYGCFLRGDEVDVVWQEERFSRHRSTRSSSCLFVGTVLPPFCGFYLLQQTCNLGLRSHKPRAVKFFVMKRLRSTYIHMQFEQYLCCTFDLEVSFTPGQRRERGKSYITPPSPRQRSLCAHKHWRQHPGGR